MSRLLLDVLSLLERLPLGRLSPEHRAEVVRLMCLAGGVATVEHGNLFYELIWCQTEISDRHRDRVIALVKEMMAMTEFTNAPPFAPVTWQEARMLALKRDCSRCIWWRGKDCAARDLVDKPGDGPLPERVATDMRDCKRDRHALRNAVVKFDEV